MATDDHVHEETPIGIEVRETPTDQLLTEFEELQERVEWVRDELNFRFSNERLLEGGEQKTAIADALNDYDE